MTDERKIDRSELLDFRATLRAAVNAATKRLSYLPFGEVSVIIKTLEGQVDELDDILGGLMGGCEGCDSPLYATDEYYTDEDGCSTCMECAPTDEDLEPTPQQGAEVPEGEGPKVTLEKNVYEVVEPDREMDPIEPSTGGEEDGPLNEGEFEARACGPLETISDISADQAFDGDGDPDPDLTLSLDTGEASPLASTGAPASPAPEEPTPAARFWGQRYQPASEEQKQGSTEAQSPLTDAQLTHIGKGA